MAPGSLDAYRTSVWSLTEFVDAANALLPGFLPKDTSGRLADDVNPRLVRHYATLGLLPEPAKEGREARYLFEHLAHLLAVRKLLAEGFGSAAIRDALAGRSADELVALLEGHVRVALVPEGATSGVEAYASAHRAAAPPREPSSPPEPSSAAASRSRAELLRAVRAKAGLGPMDQGERRVSSAVRGAPEHGEAGSSHERHGATPEAQLRRMLSTPAPASPARSSSAPSSPTSSSPTPSSPTPPRRAPSSQAPSSQAPSDDAPSSQASDADERFHAALAAIFRPSDWTRIRIDEGLELHVRDDYRLPRNRVGDEDLLRLLKAALLDLEQRTKGRS